MGKYLLARWQNLLLPPGVFNIGDFVGHLQQEVVSDSVCMMFHLLYQPTLRDPALVVMENTLPLLDYNILLCSGRSCMGPMFSEFLLEKSNCVASKAGVASNAMKCRLWTPPCKFPRSAGAPLISAGLAA